MQPYNLLSQNILDLLDEDDHQTKIAAFFNGDKAYNIVNTLITTLNKTKKENNWQKYHQIMEAFANLPGTFFKELPQKNIENFLVFLFKEECLLDKINQHEEIYDLEHSNQLKQNFLKLTNRILSNNLFIGADFLYNHFTDLSFYGSSRSQQEIGEKFIDQKIKHVKSYYIQGKFNKLLSSFHWYKYESYKHDLLPLLANLYINKDLISLAYQNNHQKQFIKKYKNDFVFDRDSDELLDNSTALLELLNHPSAPVLINDVSELIIDLIMENSSKLNDQVSPYHKKNFFISLINLHFNSNLDKINQKIIFLAKNSIKQLNLKEHEILQINEHFSENNKVNDFFKAVDKFNKKKAKDLKLA